MIVLFDHYLDMLYFPFKAISTVFYHFLKQSDTILANNLFSTFSANSHSLIKSNTDCTGYFFKGVCQVTVQTSAKVVRIMRQIDALYQFVCINVAVHTNNVQNLLQFPPSMPKLRIQLAWV